MEFTLHPLVPEDLPTLLGLIRELAQFERLEHEVEATVESLRDSFFGPQPVAGALLARWDEAVAGYAIYYSTFSSFVGRRGIWLDDLYVRPAFRQQGLGRKLIVAVAQIAAERNCGRYEWSALNWNRNALDFYRALGAQEMPDWVLLRMNHAGLRRLAGVQAGSPPREQA
jgi:GNAT superfamily N-acetyltransferase